jgi:hypothetical protein
MSGVTVGANSGRVKNQLHQRGKAGIPFDLKETARILCPRNQSMAKLVLLSEGMTGRVCELLAEKTTIGRIDENTFPIADPSVSSRHCEIILRGSDVVVKDNNSTNGSFIDGNQISGEAVLKHGQILRLGQIQMRLETGAAPASAAAASAPAAPARTDQTMVMPRGAGGVSLGELEKGPRNSAPDTKVFAKKNNKGNLWFIIAVVVGVLVIIGGLLVAMSKLKN